jgi:hypothetical protein
MKCTMRNAGDADTVHATIRMTAAEYKELHAYMHTKGDTIRFPYGAYIVVRGRGWYRAVIDNSYKAVENIRFVCTVIHRFLRDKEEATVAAIKALIPQVIHNTKLVAFSTFHSPEDRVYLKNQQPPKPAEPHMLQRLAAKFAH